MRAPPTLTPADTSRSGHGGHNSMFPGRPVTVHDFDFIGGKRPAALPPLGRGSRPPAVYPQGANYNGRSGWNDGSFGPGCCGGGGGGDLCRWDQFNCTADPNDGRWIAEIIATVAGMGARGRWYAYGSSNGANEAQILAANAVVHPAGLPIVGIAVHSGQMLAEPTRSAPSPYNYNQPCAGDQPCSSAGGAMAQLSIHGTADAVIPYAGGPRFNSPTFILAHEWASNQVWARQNNCSGGVRNETVPATYGPGTATTAVHSSWEGCPERAPVELYTVAGSPHVGCRTLRDKVNAAPVPVTCPRGA